MKLGLEGKRALVTGASYGLGFSCAKALVAEGADVVLAARGEDRLRSAVAQISTNSSAKVYGVSADLTKEGDLKALVQNAQQLLTNIDILVLSTGHPPTFPFSEASDEQWEEGYRLILRPAIVLSRAFIKEMRARSFGRIVFIGSIFGLEPEKTSVIQSTFRTGLNAFAKCIATEYAASGITVNVICPGYFDTPLVQNLAKQYAERTGGSFAELERICASA